MDLLSKNKILFWIIGILIILNVLSIGALWLFKSKRPHPPNVQMNNPPMKDGKMFLGEELNLSKQQMDEFQKLRDEHFIKVNTIQEDIRKLKDDMYNLLVSKNADSIKASGIAGKMSEKQKELELTTFNHFKKLRDICSEEQKAKFDILLKEILRNIGPHPGEHHPGEFHKGPPMEHPGEQPK